MANCFCIGKRKGCTCGGRCACACTCFYLDKKYSLTDFDTIYSDLDENTKPSDEEFTQPPNCS